MTRTLRKVNSHFYPTQTGRVPHHHVEVVVNWFKFYVLCVNSRPLMLKRAQGVVFIENVSFNACEIFSQLCHLQRKVFEH